MAIDSSDSNLTARFTNRGDNNNNDSHHRHHHHQIPRISTLISSFRKKTKQIGNQNPQNLLLKQKNPQPKKQDQTKHRTLQPLLRREFARSISSNNLSSLPLSICDEIEEEDNLISSSSALPTSSSSSSSTSPPPTSKALNQSSLSLPLSATRPQNHIDQQVSDKKNLSSSTSPASTSPPFSSPKLASSSAQADPHLQAAEAQFRKSSDSRNVLSQPKAPSDPPGPALPSSSTFPSRAPSPPPLPPHLIRTVKNTRSLSSSVSDTTLTSLQAMPARKHLLPNSNQSLPSQPSSSGSSSFSGSTQCPSLTAAGPITGSKWTSEFFQFPISRQALEPVMKHRGSLLKFSPLPPAGFWLQKTPKIWRNSFCCITAIFPHNHPGHDPNLTLFSLHGFASASPSSSDLESFRLRLEPNSIVCVLEDKLYGKSLVLKVTGQEMLAAPSDEDHHHHQQQQQQSPSLIRKQSTKGINPPPSHPVTSPAELVEAEATWLFAMEGVSHLKAWMKVLKEIVNGLKLSSSGSSSRSDATPMPNRPMLAGGSIHDDRSLRPVPSKARSLSSSSALQNSHGSNKPLAASVDAAYPPLGRLSIYSVLTSKSSPADQSLNLPNQTPESNKNGLVPSSDPNNRPSSQASAIPSSASSASTDLPYSPRTDYDPSSPTRMAKDDTVSGNVGRSSSVTSILLQKRATELERLRRGGDRSHPFRDPTSLENEARSPIETSFEQPPPFLKLPQIRAPPVLPSLPCPPRTRLTRKTGPPPSLKVSNSLSSTRTDSFLTDSDPPSPLSPPIIHNSSIHSKQLQPRPTRAHPSVRADRAKPLSVRGLDEEILAMDEMSASDLDIAGKVVQNPNLKPRAIKLPPIPIQGGKETPAYSGHGSPNLLRHDVGSGSLFSLTESELNSRLTDDRANFIQINRSESSLSHVSENAWGTSEFSPSLNSKRRESTDDDSREIDGALEYWSTIGHASELAGRGQRSMASSFSRSTKYFSIFDYNHRQDSEEGSKEDGDEHNPERGAINRSQSESGCPSGSENGNGRGNQSSTLSISSSSFEVRMKKDVTLEGSRKGSMNGNLIYLNSSNRSLLVPSPTQLLPPPPPPKFPPPNISLPELPKE